MKKMILFLLTLSCCSMSFARTDLKKSKVSVLKRGELVRLCYEGPSTSVVEVSILDNKGKELFNEEIKAKSFIRPYNFSELPSGKYQLIVKDETGEHIENVMYYDRAFIGHVSQLKSDKNKYLVTIPKHGENEVTVCVFDSQDNIVFSEVAKKHEDYAKIYKLKNLQGARIELFDRD